MAAAAAGGAGGAGDAMGGAGGGLAALGGVAARKPTFHLCIINLVIGTLYCAKGNYEFGISRILKSLEPLDRKLGTDTWYYAKRCFVALAEVLAKHMITLRDSVFDDILSFLEESDRVGKGIQTVIAAGSATATLSGATGAAMATGAAAAAAAAAGGAGGGAGGGGVAGGGDGVGAGDTGGVLGATLAPSATRTVSYEARLLRKMYLHLKDEH